MSLRDFFRRITPAQHHVREHRHFRFMGQMFGERLHSPDIWSLTRRSVAGGVAVGVFFAALPTFGQMLFAAIAAIWFRVNLPVALAFTWVSNPLTMPPFFYISYQLGSRLLGWPLEYKQFHLSFQWIYSVMHDIWLPLLIGCVILGSIATVVSYYVVSILWRLVLMRKRDDRRIKRPFMRKLQDRDETERKDD